MSEEGAREFVERFAGWLEHSGVPRMAGRVLGWLLVCEPVHQSGDDLTAALQASRGSISTTTRMLATAGLVERVTFPGDRRTYYRAIPNWNSLLESQLKQVGALRQIIEDGLEAVAGASAAARLQQVHDFASFWEDELARLLAERRGG
jgi:DNA-binding transcriptional regulator GbsR (MarR family)